MADFSSMKRRYRLIVPDDLYRRLDHHLFPGDHDEHGAVIVAGIAESKSEVRLLARELFLAADGIDYVPGKRGYRMLKAGFIADRIAMCGTERLVYLAIHNHGGCDSVQFSSDDLRSHQRGYPALLDIARGMPVGALVFAENAVAGSIWLSGDRQIELSEIVVVGRSRRRLTAAPTRQVSLSSPVYDRQARLFGDLGQAILGRAKVGIIGLGGAGSLIAEYLGRLGVGSFVLVDPDRAELSNLPRLTGASRWDALGWLASEKSPKWLQQIAFRLAKPKVLMARRNILRANPSAKVETIIGDFLEADIAARFTDCDYLFLAADTARARLLFNAIVHQYLIPGVQVGAKVQVDRKTGEVTDVFSVVRPVTPESGCLLCNGLINAAKLQEESISEQERRGQRYVDDPDVIAPSVITLNAVAVSHATDDFLFYMTGLRDPNAPTSFMRFHPRGRQVWSDEPRKSPSCPECGQGPRSRLARGDARRLPVIERTKVKTAEATESGIRLPA
ncbi:ThiF family adenylyltransferase [Acidicapsa acidisoli]|uniref:ThiF family adenylyltransferase n=1 Tax=Acidicapsa acidisoli TaxID=1615681 RepID=UPI0021DFD41D|nr:ThiF family adenylyltransferase [Acidicapsa acidisoli]